MCPMSDLLKENVAWTWGAPQQLALEQVQQLITSAPVSAYYDVNKHTVLAADASSYGLGGAIYQLHGDELRPVAFCSHTLLEAEKRYAQMKKKCLAAC